MFKNVTLYRIDPTWKKTTAQIEAGLSQMRFVSCAASQLKSTGWSEPRGEPHGPLVETVDGQLVMQLSIEGKLLPASVVKRRTTARVKMIEETTGRKLSRMERKDLHEESLLDLLPKAFTRITNTPVWIDPKAYRLVVGTASQSLADEVVAALSRSLEGFVLTPVQSETSPSTCMSSWLMQHEAPRGFDVDRDCELRATDETQSVARYTKHNLDFDKLRKHLQDGKQPTQLSLTWNGRISFSLTDKLQVKKIKFLEGVTDTDGANGKNTNRFEADVAIATGELGRLFPELMDALGGEAVAA